MSNRGVVRGTRRRRSISDSGHPRLNSTILNSDLVSDEHDLVNKFETLRIKISAWESIIKYELHSIDSIKANHNQLIREIQSLYQESIHAHASVRLSYDIIGLLSLISWIKNAAIRLIRNDKGMDGDGLRG